MSARSGTNNEQLAVLIKGVAEEMHEEQLGYWQFEIANISVFVITDEAHNRMRIISPVAELASLSKEVLQILLEANYDRALDARYCINGDAVWSAFLHPLRELDDQQFLAALEQVITLGKNFGSSYSSSGLIFGG